MSKHMRNLLARLILLVAAAAVIPACGSGGGGGSASPSIGGLTYTSRGGTGLDYGGDGGYFSAYAYTGSDLSVLPTGNVNAGVNLPAIISPHLGSNPAIISANTVWNVGDELSVGVNTVNVGGTVTGIWVKPGVTLTIQPNYDESGAGGLRDAVRISLSRSFLVEGTIRIDYQDATFAGDSASNNCSNFQIDSAENVVVRPGGSILVKGKDVPGGTGGDGGYYYDRWGTWGTVVNQGTISTAGGDGNDGGYGGELCFGYVSQYGSYNTGTLASNGGAGAAGYGGGAGSLYFRAGSGYGPLMNSGTVSAKGGDGTNGGGSGGHMDWYTNHGAIVNSGTVTTAGGNATNPAANGGGGSGGSFYLYAYGEIRMTGSLTTAGGSGVGTGGDGGNGGNIDINGDYNYDWGDNGYTTFGMHIGCNINTNGGNGQYGGNAGHTYYYRYSEGHCRPGKEPICLVGYSTIDVSGGDGGIDGGYAGGSNYLYAGVDYDETSTYYYGSLIVASNIIARGGDGGTGWGGEGAYISLSMDSSHYTTQGSDYGVFNSGTLDSSGGDGAYGSTGGGVYLYGRFKTVNSGTLLANGGDGTTGDGGSPNNIYIYGSLDIVNTGAVSCNGGNSASGDGAYGGSIYIYGLNVTAGGRYSANGGDGGTGAGDNGGDGGWVGIVSQESATAWSGTASVLGGAGATDGTDGDFYLDGIHVSGQ